MRTPPGQRAAPQSNWIEHPVSCREKDTTMARLLHHRALRKSTRKSRIPPALALEEIAAALDPLRRDRPEPNRKRQIQAFLFDRYELLELTADAAGGDKLAGQLVHAIAGWLSRAEAAAPGQAPMCLDCSVVFRAGLEPTAFALALVEGDDHAIVTGVCTDSNERAERGEGLLAVAIARWRKELWPDLQ